MKKKSLLIVIIILLMVLCLILGIIFKMNIKKEETTNVTEYVEEKNNNYENLESVKSATAYFTIQSCVNKYINYVSDKDEKSVLTLLDSNYLINNNINENNVFDKIKDVPNLTTFEAEKMYMETIDDNNNKYYVSGVLREENSEESKVIDNEFYIIVNVDLENMIFSIEPLEDGGIFNEKTN